jgi:DivIVA domain-containing protein
VTLVALLVVLAVVGVVAAVVTGTVRGGLDEPTSSLAPSGLPEGDLTAEDLRAVRFSLGFRGYRMDEVDDVLDRLTVELVRRDAELAALRGQAESSAAETTAAEPEPAQGPSTGVDAGARANGAAVTDPDGQQPEDSHRHHHLPGHHVPGRHEGSRREGAVPEAHRPRSGSSEDDQTADPDDADAAPVGRAHGGAGWSGPEGH